MPTTRPWAGAVYIFRVNNLGKYEQYQKLSTSDRQAGDMFGYTLTANDSILVISALEDEPDTMSIQSSNVGSIYIFKKDVSGYWKEKQKFYASDFALYDGQIGGAEMRYGQSLSLHDSILIVGDDENKPYTVQFRKGSGLRL